VGIRLKVTVGTAETTDVVQSLQAAASGIKDALATLDEAARTIATPEPSTASSAPIERSEAIKQVPGPTLQTTTDLTGAAKQQWPEGSVFAPGFLHADRRGLVAWPGLDAQITRFLSQRSVEANATVFKQAQESYRAVEALGHSTAERRSA
jgi:flagellar basal body rod protein FlgC